MSALIISDSFLIGPVVTIQPSINKLVAGIRIRGNRAAGFNIIESECSH